MGLVHKIGGRQMSGPDDIQVKDVLVTSAQLLAYTTTPVSLIAAPGANKAIVLEQVIGKMNGGTVAYTANNVAEIRYTDGSGALMCGNLPFTAFLNANSSTAYYRSNPADAIPVANAAVVIRSAANQTAGNGTLKLRLFFRVINFAGM